MEDNSFIKLLESLEQLITVHKSMLEVVRLEFEALTASDMEQLSEINAAKEKLVLKARSADAVRQRYVRELCRELNIKDENPRLSELAMASSMENGERLRNLHSVLTLIVQRVYDQNQQNAVLAQKGLEVVNGQLNSIRESASGNSKVYKREGEISNTGSRSGHFISKEA
jgi:flagellar biosynthesis/type III secretory pathway chaperone